KDVGVEAKPGDELRIKENRTVANAHGVVFRVRAFRHWDARKLIVRQRRIVRKSGGSRSGDESERHESYSNTGSHALISPESCAAECLEAFVIHNPVRMTPDSKTNFVQRDAFRKNLRRLFDILPHGFFIGAKSCHAAAQRAAT